MTPEERRKSDAEARARYEAMVWAAKRGPGILDSYWTPEQLQAAPLWPLAYIADTWAAAYGHPHDRVNEN
jgi:hypothetical protein